MSPWICSDDAWESRGSPSYNWPRGVAAPCQRPGGGLRWWPSRSPHPGVFQWWVSWSSPPVGGGEAAVGAAVMLAGCVLGNADAAAAPGGGAAGWRAESGWGADFGVGEHPGHCGDHKAPAAGAGEAFPVGGGARAGRPLTGPDRPIVLVEWSGGGFQVIRELGTSTTTSALPCHLKKMLQVDGKQESQCCQSI